MSKDGEKKERRCIVCKKLLIDEKVPVCRLCQRKYRKQAEALGAAALSIGLAFAGMKRKNPRKKS